MNTATLIYDHSTDMAPIDEAVALLKSAGDSNVSEVARKFNVERSTLSKHFRGKRGSIAKANERKQLLSNSQETVLANHIQRLCDWCLPPTPAMVATWAEKLCGQKPNKNWLAGFKARHKDVLDCRFLNAIDLARHKADSTASYRQYFSTLKEKMNQYSIQPHNCYNMDEKGFLIGRLHKVRRLFPKALVQRQKLLGAGQDGSRQWITLIATICADGSSLPPALIYKATSGDLQDSWLQDYDPQEHPCWFASSPNGWTSDELGLSWLKSLFHEQTASKAGRDWRLLILDGHGSHCTLSFLEWCRSHKILVAVFPPHSTHRLQPLDVSLFGPLATYYSQELDAHSRLSQGLAGVTKRDFFKNFYSAFDNAFTEANVRSGWRKTGIEPFDPHQVLDVVDKKGRNQPETSRVESVPSRHSSSCLDTPSAQRTIRRIVDKAVAERDAETEKIIRKLGGACVTLSAKLRLAEDREKGYVEALNDEKKKRKRGQPFTEELRGDEGVGALFFSPSKIQRARELQDAKEAAKEREALEKASRAEARAVAKAQKELQAQRKREERAARVEARKAEHALKRAQKEQIREAKKVQKQLQIDSTAAQKRQRSRLAKQKPSGTTVPTALALAEEVMPIRPRSRRGRPIKRPARLEEK
jgi:hypothetical protein